MKNIIMAAVIATVMGVGSAHAQGLYIGVGGEYVKSTAHNVDATAAASLRAGVDINKYIAGELAVNPAMSTNKHNGIRAALCWNEEITKLARQHNDANILVLPARFISEEETKKCISVFLSERFEGGRHADRIKKVDWKN